MYRRKRLGLSCILVATSIASSYAGCKIDDVNTKGIVFECDTSTNMVENKISFSLPDGAYVSSAGSSDFKAISTQNGNRVSLSLYGWQGQDFVTIPNKIETINIQRQSPWGANITDVTIGDSPVSEKGELKATLSSDSDAIPANTEVTLKSSTTTLTKTWSELSSVQGISLNVGSYIISAEVDGAMVRFDPATVTITKDSVANITADYTASPSVAKTGQIVLKNNTKNAISLQFKISSKDSEVKNSISENIKLEPKQSKIYSFCKSWWIPAPISSAGILIVAGSKCKGNDPNTGSSLTGSPESVSDVETTYTASINSDSQMKLFTGDSGEIVNLENGYDLNIDTKSLSLKAAITLHPSDEVVQNSNQTYDIEADQGSFIIPAVSEGLELYSDFSNLKFSGNYSYSGNIATKKPFSQLEFNNKAVYTISKPKSQDSVDITVSQKDLSALHINGWPSHVAMGSVMDFSNQSLSETIERKDQIDALFRYAGLDGGGDNGKDPISIFNSGPTKRLVSESKSLFDSYGKTAIPVTVIYTTNASGGSQIEAEKQVTDENLLTKHLAFLAIAANYLQNNPIGVNNSGTTVRGSIVLNPDTYGEGNKDHYYKNVVTPINSALLDMIDYLQVNKIITDDNVISQAKANIERLFPSDTGTNFKTYNQALNWIVHTFAPDVSYGFADNVWAGDASGHGWLHQTNYQPTSLQNHIDKEGKYLVENGVYGNSGDYPNPTFVAFDKYERNTFGSIPGIDINNNPWAPYFYSMNDWSVYLQYVGGVSKYLQQHQDNQTVPVMLFQIPGGHIPTSQEMDNWKYGATAPDYFLGDRDVCSQSDVLSSAVANYLGNTLSILYGDTNTSRYKTYLDYLYQPVTNINTYDGLKNTAVSCLTGGHMADLVSNNVFAIMWGGGSTSSIAGPGPQNDNGYLANLISRSTNYMFDSSIS